MLWMGIWVNPYTVALVSGGIYFWERNWVMVEPELCCKVMVEEATNHCRLHPTSISYVYKVFYHLDMLLMGLLVHPYTVDLV